MILFLNFAPIKFMGGSEKNMLDIASYVNKSESSIIVDVSSSISSLYGKLILNRNFDSHAKDHNTKGNRARVISLSFRHFIPLSKKWKDARAIFKKTRLIYARYELPEIFILLYFGGLGILKKNSCRISFKPLLCFSYGYEG